MDYYCAVLRGSSSAGEVRLPRAVLQMLNAVARVVLPMLTAAAPQVEGQQAEPGLASLHYHLNAVVLAAFVSVCLSVPEVVVRVARAGLANMREVQQLGVLTSTCPAQPQVQVQHRAGATCDLPQRVLSDHGMRSAGLGSPVSGWKAQEEARSCDGWQTRRQ